MADKNFGNDEELLKLDIEQSGKATRVFRIAETEPSTRLKEVYKRFVAVVQRDQVTRDDEV